MYSHPGVDRILKCQNLTTYSIYFTMILYHMYVLCINLYIYMYDIIYICVYIIVSHDIPLYTFFCWLNPMFFGGSGDRFPEEPRSLSKGRGQELRRSGSWWHAHLALKSTQSVQGTTQWKWCGVCILSITWTHISLSLPHYLLATQYVYIYIHV